MLFERLQAQIPDFDWHSGHPLHRHSPSLRLSLFLHHLQRHNSGTDQLQDGTHIRVPLDFAADGPVFSFGHIRYFSEHSGLIRKKNKFVAFYAVTMGLYMISFMILGIGTAATQQYITSQCGSG